MSASDAGTGAGAGAGAASSGASGSGSGRTEWAVEESIVASRTNNPIRKVVDNIKIPDNPDVELIPLSLGDPTIFGNLNVPSLFVDTLVSGIRSYKHNGYIHAAGLPTARAAIATRYSLPGNPLTADDCVITSGCSGAIEMAINALMNPGDSILLPSPGFALYQTIAESKGITCKFYRLLPERQWAADLDDLASKIDSTTKAILVNNPSNPCGSVFSKEHLEDILAIADANKVPIIADEIYGNLTFEGEVFHPMASLTTTVPVLTVGGIAKEFLVPGWRIGWVIVYDKNGVLAPIRKALFKLSQLILTSCSLVQAALPRILAPEAGSADETELKKFHDETVAQLEGNAKFTVDEVSKIPGLRVVVPQGAMYVMFGFDPERFPTIKDDVAFSQLLLDEESVFVLPGQCFGIANYCRIVFCAPQEKLRVAYERLAAFCARHSSEA